MKKKLRILHAPTEIAGQAFLLTRGLNQLGYKAKVLDYREEKVFNRDLDINIPIYKYPKILSWPIKSGIIGWSLMNFDVFHFHFGRTLIGNSELLFRILKKFNKKIVVHFHGSDIRDTNIIIQNAEKGNIWEAGTPTTREKNKLIDLSKKYADKIIVSTPDLLELVGKKKGVWLPVSVEPELKPKKSKKTDRGVLKIVHAPSNPEVKGTSYIVAAVQNIKNVELIFLHNASRKKVIEVLSAADIVIDQVIIGWYGLLSVEAMSLGKPVICYLRKDLEKKYTPDVTIINSNFSDLSKNLPYIIKDTSLLQALRVDGVKFVRETHSLDKNVIKLAKIYESL